MANLNKSRGKNNKEKPALQLTSYQLVMAICALLLLMCVLFIAGILVQRFSDRGQHNPVAVNNSATLEPSRPSGATPSAPKTEGVQVAPRPVTLPAEGAQPGPAMAKKTTEPDAKYIPAPPPRRDRGKPTPKPETSSTTSKPEMTAKETPESTPVSEPSTPVKPAAPEAPKTESTPPVKTEPAKAAESPPPPQTTEEPKTNSTETTEDSEKGPFTVQVASFDSNNLDRAKRFKTDVEKDTDYSVNLVPSSDGKHVRAYVGEYADRAAADKARDSMRKIEDFKDCFVKALNEE